MQLWSLSLLRIKTLLTLFWSPSAQNKGFSESVPIQFSHLIGFKGKLREIGVISVGTTQIAIRKGQSARGFAQTGAFRQSGAAAGVIWRDHGVIARQAPFFAVSIWREIIFHARAGPVSPVCARLRAAWTVPIISASSSADALFAPACALTICAVRPNRGSSLSPRLWSGLSGKIGQHEYDKEQSCRHHRRKSRRRCL